MRIHLLLDLRDTRGNYIEDPRVIVRFALKDFGTGPVTELQVRGRPAVVVTDLADGGQYTVEVTPSLFSPCYTLLTAARTEQHAAARLVHRASEWTAQFTAWSQLPANLTRLIALLQNSPALRVGRNTTPALFTGSAYDDVDPRDESRVFAKMSILNMCALLTSKPRPERGGAWFEAFVGLQVATRERVIGQIEEADASLIERLANKAVPGATEYKKEPAALHAQNFAWIPDFTFDPKRLLSIKTKDEFGNLQLTVARGRLGGAAAVMLDADCDENGKTLLHLFDLPKHAVTGGTHPVEIFDILAHRLPAWNFGYALQPRVRELPLTPHVDIRITPLVAPAPAAAAVHDIAVLGDSVTWGQGLKEGQKIHSLVAASLAAAGPPPRVRSLAHSGAVIGAGLTGPPPAPAHGEVPRGRPSILEQVAAFEHPDDADLVIINGGINDLDIRYILNPVTSVAELTDDTERVCGADMESLLLRTCERFTRPHSRIAVLSYYPILSKLSTLQFAPQFLEVVGAPAPTMLLATAGGPAGFDAGLFLWDRVIENCAVFHDVSTRALAGAIARVNASTGAGRVYLAAPAWSADHAALAPDPWLFGIALDWHLSPQDPVAAERHHACDLYEADLLRRQQCYRASAGHPNTLGAAEFARAVVRGLTAP